LQRKGFTRDGCPSPLSRPSRKSLTFARLPAILRPMRFALRTVAVVRSARDTRRDLFLEILALRHQLGVLSRSDRRFRTSDRLFWLCLRRAWPRWREALVLVQPATVDRWHREGFRGCWRLHSRRRPGRPRIDLQLRSLIERMATANGLWGAPRIHGELLKLDSRSPNARCRGICPIDGRDRPRPGGHSSRTTSATWRAPRR